MVLLMLPVLLLQVVALGPAEMQQYIQFCRQYMFAGQPVVTSMEDVQRLLDGWYDAADVTAGMQQQQQQQQQPPAAARCNQQAPAAAAAGQLSASAASRHGNEEQQQGQQQPAVLHDCATDSAGKAIASNYSLTLPGQGPGGSSARVAPELAAVTLVLAGYARISAVSLVDCVRRLEKQMLAVESALKVMGQMRGKTPEQVDIDADVTA
jgi:hypothetical protein